MRLANVNWNLCKYSAVPGDVRRNWALVGARPKSPKVLELLSSGLSSTLPASGVSLCPTQITLKRDLRLTVLHTQNFSGNYP